MNGDQFQDYLWRLLDGELSLEEFVDLENYLSSNADARAVLIEHIELHNILDLRLSAPPLTAGSWEGVIAVDKVLARQRSRAMKYSAIGAAAVLALMGVILALFLAPARQPTVTFRASEGSIWSVAHRDGEEPKAASVLAVGSRLELRQGSVEFTMPSGVTARAKAPADLTVLADNKILQNLGVIHYRVPKEAIGFQVESPQLRIKDLGTEFGVISRAGKSDEVHLLKGSIEVRSKVGKREESVIAKPQAFVAGPTGTLEKTALRPDEFMSELAESIPYIHFPFDSIDGTEVPVTGNFEDLADVSARLVHFLPNGGESGLTDGRFGRALQLSGNGEFVQTNWPGIGGRSPRTVAFWLRLPTDAKANQFQGIVLWGDTHDSGGKFVVNWNFFPQSGNLGALRFNSAGGNVVGETDLRDGEWHHVAVVLGGSTDPDNGMGVTLYVDGVVETASGTRAGDPDTVLGTDEDSWLSIGRFFDVDDPHRGTLRGDIDELYIFSAALAPEGIREVMRSGW
ncbi:hypothetical protein HAHE_32770 [Haloferula helveola]|uniref:FecR protein n=1 Tax=Haloferula helveola TaxID=490095 RepID=A0ABN6H742_9BACT|nr:hypothetical protein HAHE_32770 [Haloferula helveola]